MTTLKITLIVLPIIEILVFILLLIRKDKKQKKEPPCEDMPGHYEDYELSERPYYNP